MFADLHNHTTLCNHAVGTVDEYIQQAIAHNIDAFGFSEHAPMHFDPKYRLSFDQLDNYERLILDAKEKYANEIEILLAYEVDYLPRYSDEEIFTRKVDYFIGSVHFIDDWGFDNPEFIAHYKHKNIAQIWEKYFELIKAMANSGKYDIAAHLDLIKVFKFLPQKDVPTLALEAMRAIKKANMSLELNVAGFRKPIAQAYPSKSLLELAFELEIPITFGSDAHAPEQVGLYQDEIKALARSVGYTKSATYRNRDRELMIF